MKYIRTYEDLEFDELFEWARKVMDKTREYARRGISSDEVPYLKELCNNNENKSYISAIDLDSEKRSTYGNELLRRTYEICMYLSCKRLLEYPNIKDRLNNFGEKFTNFGVKFKIGNINPSIIFINVYVNFTGGRGGERGIMDYGVSFEQLENPIIYDKIKQFDL